MQQNKISILSTRLLTGDLIGRAALKGISIEVIPFIKTQPIGSVEIRKEINNARMLSATVVFTSINAVKAVGAELQGQHPDWQIFCIGHGTRKAVQEYFGQDLIAGVANSAKQVANLIIGNSHTDEVIFFCGDHRIGELPGLLRENKIQVNEIIVYETILLPSRVEKKYNGVLFFSPSSVRSFFQENKLDDQTVLFAIGSTTADEIKNFSKNKLVVSKYPNPESLLNEMIAYFQTNPIHPVRPGHPGGH
jgi:uroporphyrinogen-III synthase